jgi:hypothetical protein
MKKQLLIQKILPGLALMLLCSNLSFAQQIIGEFPGMNGGFEVPQQPVNSITPHATNWTISTTTSTTKEITTNPATARSGSNYISFSNASTGSTRLQSPIANTLANDTEYTVQYYFKAAVSPIAFLTGAIYFNTTNTKKTITANPSAFTPNTWIKASATFTSHATATGTKFASPRIEGITNTTEVISVDDFVVYAGPLDETAPNAPSEVKVNGLNVSWTATTSADVAGYVVVRYASQPATDNNPNQNGIYQVGNTFTSGTNNLQGTVVYIGTTAASPTAPFTDSVTGFYKVYAVDKAFNYSSEGTATALGTNQWSLDNPISIYPNPVKNNQFTISLPAAISGKATVGIYNINGQLVYKTDVAGADGSIDVRPAQVLAAGVYVVKVENNGNASTQKITVN